MIRAWNYIVKNDDRLLAMMSDSLSIYDQALYFQRQSYFETKKQGKIKTYSYNDLWNKVKNHEKIKASKLDINIKQYIVKQVCISWLSFIKSSIEYKKNSSKFNGRPNMPNYLYKTKDYNIVQVDKTRFRKINEETNSFNLPCSDYKISVPKQIRLKDVKQVTIQKYYGKIKINIIYEDREVLRNEYDLNLAIGIDLGINNLCAITSNDKSFSYIINGRPLKSINQFYNKRLSELKSKLEICNKKKSSKAIQKLNQKRNNKIKHYLNCCSKQLIELCIQNKVEKIIIGHNKGWKQEVNLGNKTNQNFVQIPFNQLINQIQYKSQKYTDLTVEIVEESYTSKIDHLALEKLEHQENYLGKRIKRGLFKSSINDKLINADINGAIGILRKGNAISDVQLIDLRNRGDVVSPKQFILNV